MTQSPVDSARRYGIFRVGLLWSVSLVVILQLGTTVGSAASLPQHAREFRVQLSEKVLPYWYDTAQDTEHGGYLLADDGKRRGQASDKLLVTQSRMLWGFSHAHARGFSNARRSYLEAARQGFRFLLAHFLDRENGGYFWKTDLAGVPLADGKFLYGQCFVVYAFVEYYRASGDREALRHAMDLYHAIQQNLHDRQHGGWIEHADRSWRPLPSDDRRNEVGVIGLKSANAHLHWMEALTELYDATHDPDVKKSLDEVLRINQQYFFPPDPERASVVRLRDWQPVRNPESASISYGHNVQFAWLMVRAEQALGRIPSWKHCDVLLDHALRYGYDKQRGGLYYRGLDNRPATDTDKVWWVQAELLDALSTALQHRANAQYEQALEGLLHFLVTYQIDPADGIWLDTVTADGRPKNPAKAHNWKANYHDLRAMIRFIEAFAPR